jgi:F-type H+-transporting ATPase subunit b
MFGIVFVTLKAWVYKPLLNMMDKRSKAIAQGLEDARVAADARANAEKEASKIIADAQNKASQIVKEATDRADVAGREVRSNADAEAAKAREAAMQEVEMERTRILGELRSQVATLAISAAQKVISETLDEQRQRTLLDEFFSGVRNGKVVVIENENVTGASAEITSALPLTSGEQDSVKRDILSKIGDAATVSFRVDPTLLGGLVVKVGDKVMDGSVAGQLNNLRQTLG